MRSSKQGFCLYLKWTRHYIGGWWGGFHYWTVSWRLGTQTVANSYTPTPYDCLSIMHYAGLKMKVTGDAVAGCKKSDFTQENILITNYDAQTVRDMYK